MKPHDPANCLHCIISEAIINYLDSKNLRMIRTADVPRPAVMAALGMVAGEIIAEVDKTDADHRAALINGLLDAASERIEKCDKGILAHVPR